METSGSESPCGWLAGKQQQHGLPVCEDRAGGMAGATVPVIWTLVSSLPWVYTFKDYRKKKLF